MPCHGGRTSTGRRRSARRGLSCRPAMSKGSPRRCPRGIASSSTRGPSASTPRSRSAADRGRRTPRCGARSPTAAPRSASSPTIVPVLLSAIAAALVSHRLDVITALVFSRATGRGEIEAVDFLWVRRAEVADTARDRCRRSRVGRRGPQRHPRRQRVRGRDRSPYRAGDAASRSGGYARGREFRPRR